MVSIVLFGPPGSGKGTQSQKLIEKYGLIHLSTGDILRKEIVGGTELGKKAKKYMDVGELVPDEDVIAMVINKLAEYVDPLGFIFDGFPRTRDQARSIRHNLTDMDLRINIMITLEVPREELISRLIKRGEETGRSDDERNIIEKRLDIYHKQSKPVIDFYEKMRKYVAIDGTGTIDEIFDRIVCAVEACI